MAHNDEDLRNAAESLLRSNESYQNQNIHASHHDISHSQSINTIPSIRPEYVISEDIFAGYRVNGRMSSIRRFFCLFVTFDLLFIGLMWLICIMLHGENIMTALNEQIYHYNIHSSLFDIVLAAVCRFTILLLFYALLYMNHWVIISLSTAGTCFFLISKVFCYDWQKSNQPVFEVLLVLASFILAWGETWFLDFRVLPQEFHAKHFVLSTPNSERAPLLQNYLQNLPSVYTESIGNFYSPFQSPEGSIRRFDSCRHVRYLPVTLSAEQEDIYKNFAEKTFKEADDILNSSNWKLAKQSPDGDSIYTMESSKIGKIFLLQGVLNVSPNFALEEIIYTVDNIPQWNNRVLESQKVQVINEHTDITYYVAAEAAGGAISKRDFVTLRHWKLVDGTYVIAYKATEHPSIPKRDKCTRGENGIGCWTFKPVPGDSNKCAFQWVLNTDLKGWLPQSLVNTALMGSMFEHITCFRTNLNREQEKLRTTI